MFGLNSVCLYKIILTKVSRSEWIQTVKNSTYNISIYGYFQDDDATNLLNWFLEAIVTKYHKLSGLNNVSLLSHSSGGYKSKFKVLAGLVFLRVCEKESVLGLSPSFWWFAGNLWPSLAYRYITPISAFIFTWCSPWCMSVPTFPFLIRTPVILD